MSCCFEYTLDSQDLQLEWALGCDVLDMSPILLWLQSPMWWGVLGSQRLGSRHFLMFWVQCHRWSHWLLPPACSHHLFCAVLPCIETWWQPCRQVQRVSLKSSLLLQWWVYYTGHRDGLQCQTAVGVAGHFLIEFQCYKKAHPWIIYMYVPSTRITCGYNSGWWVLSCWISSIKGSTSLNAR